MSREEAIESLRGILTEAVEFENSVCYVTEEDREPLEMAIKALEQEPCDVFDEYGNYKYPSDVKLTEPNTATSMPCEDAISREDALMCLTGEWTEITDEIIHRFIKRIKALPPVNPQPKAEQFAKWVAGEIFDDMWEYNKDAFAEIACRKLAKLGIVIRMGDEWELIEPQESEDKE